MNGSGETTQWVTIKQEQQQQQAQAHQQQQITTAYNPCEWKIEEKKSTKQIRGIGRISTTNLPTIQTVEVKPVVTQIVQPQTIATQQNSWENAGITMVATSSSDTGWSTIKWENTNAVVQKPTSTINMAGLQFVSAPAVQANNNVNIIHTGRKTNPIIETFKCELCNQIFANISVLQDHILAVHEVNNGSKKSKLNPLTLHCEYKYSGVSLEEAIVQSSPKAVATTNALSSSPINTVIVATNDNVKPKKEKRRNWQCSICQNRFTRKDHLQKHVMAVHEKIRPFECGQCGQKFSQKHHLHAHILARHEDDKLASKAFACHQCPKRFTRNDHLERHLESVHEKRKSFECTVCQTQFSRKHHLSKHIMAVHAKVKPYGCHMCDMSFLQRHHLGAHIMQAHQPPVQEEPDGSKTYICAICSHRFKRKDHLKKHVETVHERHRAYACSLCDKRFGQKYHLAIHVSAVHEGKKPYACDLCAHRSARKSGLQRHMKTVHNIPPQPLQQIQQGQTLQQLQPGQTIQQVQTIQIPSSALQQLQAGQTIHADGATIQQLQLDSATGQLQSEHGIQHLQAEQTIQLHPDQLQRLQSDQSLPLGEPLTVTVTLVNQ